MNLENEKENKKRKNKRTHLYVRLKYQSAKVAEEKTITTCFSGPHKYVH
jgi:hypothetical protein